MSRLTLYPDTQPENIILDTTDGSVIAQELNKIGVRFERWKTQEPLPADADDEAVMRAYANDIDRLKTENGYQSVDVIRLSSDHPDKVALRNKFLSEHTHSEDEVRFFVEGAGIFYLRVNDKVYMTLCERGDLMSVPTGTKHWFDMGPEPHLTCIRLFTSKEGWVADFTGDEIAEAFPKFDNNQEEAAQIMPDNIRAIITDIEGTTSSLSFVKDTLFPYAYNHLPDYVWDHDKEIADLLDAVREEERNPELNLEEVIEVLLRYIDEDQKITPLKTLQGMIWEEGYKNGELVGHIYDDALHGLKRWKDQGIDLYVYSSGSVPAQKLLFGYTKDGDLTPLFSGYYDTNIGGKKVPESYEKIAEDINIPTSEILFLSDSIEEITAASSAGMNVIILDRAKDMPDSYGHTIVHDFDDILPEVVDA